MFYADLCMELLFAASQKDVSSVSDYGTVKRQIPIYLEISRVCGFAFVEIEAQAKEMAVSEVLNGVESVSQESKS